LIHHQIKILYAQFITYGDILASTAIIRELKNKYDKSSIHYFTREDNKELLEFNPDIDQIYYERSLPIFEEYDIIFRPYYCLQKSGGWNLNNSHWLDLYAEVCGVKLLNYELYFYNMSQFFTVPNDPYILVQSRTNDSAKDWDRYSEFVSLFKNKFEKIKVFQIGSGVQDTISNIDGKYFNLRWSQVAKLINNAITIVCLDSIAQHLAGALNASYICLYGAKPSHLVRTGRFDNAKQIAIEPSRDECKTACGFANCTKKVKCINTISPEFVLDLFDRKIFNG